VVSLGTSPPHVAHGCGATLDEAQNTVSYLIVISSLACVLPV